jgi:hypothetical protein
MFVRGPERVDGGRKDEYYCDGGADYEEEEEEGWEVQPRKLGAVHCLVIILVVVCCLVAATLQ